MRRENTTEVRRILIIIRVLCDVLEALLHPHILLLQTLLLLLQQDPSQLQLLQHGPSITRVARLTGTPETKLIKNLQPNWLAVSGWGTAKSTNLTPDS